jgi:superfamily II DNA or RNA helicase
MIELLPWQQQAWEKFKENNYRGIIEAATGTGKTFLGLKLIDEFCESILIVVPTIVLQQQWYDDLLNKLHIYPTLIGRLGGGYNDTKKITIAVINSLRGKEVEFNSLILDECHHYLSDKSVSLLVNNTFKRILALSATVKRGDDRDYSIFNLKVIFKYSLNDAISNRDLCEYSLINTGVILTSIEREKYMLYDKIVRELFPKYGSDVFGGPWSIEKNRLRRSIAARKSVIMNAEVKVAKAVELIMGNLDKKIIVFSEYISTLKSINYYLELNQLSASIYFSGNSNNLNSIGDFKSNKTNILLCVKALDEGINVPLCDMAIIVAGNKTSRQIIQRLGRVLRKKDKEAVIYQIYVKDSIDVKYINERMKYIKGYNGVLWE